jgi:hypothetical protein
MLALLALVASVAVGSAISELRLPDSRAVLAPVAAGAGIGGALLAVRFAVTRRELRSRVGVVVVPADEFDPSLEAVLRFASQLGRVRRRVRGWLDKRASAVRVTLTNDREGRLVYLVEAPGHAQDSVRAALRGFAGLELREPDDLSDVGSAGRAVVRAELVLARPSAEPLRLLELDPDPLQAFATAVPRHPDDRALVCVDLLPTTAAEGRRLRRRLLRSARQRGAAGGMDALEWLDRPQVGRRTPPSELAERRAEGRALDAKLADPGSMFRLQVLVRVESPDPARAKAGLRSLLGCFDQLAARNWLRVSGLALPGLAFLGPDLPGRRQWFDGRLRSGLFRPARRSVVSAREVAGFLKPPTVRCGAQNVLRAGALVPPPPVLPEFGGQQELIPLGLVTGHDGERLVGVRLADTFFAYVAGRSRYGKTELALCQFLHLVRSGHGGMFIDPHQDAVARLKPYLTDDGVRQRVVEIDLADPRAHDRQPAWNLFELTGPPATGEARVEALVDAIASALRWDERNNRALTVTTQAAQALAAVARTLPVELAPTIFQLPTLLSDDEWRAAVLPLLPAASRRFWLDRFPRLSDEAITPVTNLIDRLRVSTPITALLGQSQSSYRIADAMDRGLIVLACPGSGGARDRLVANLLLFDLLHAARARAALAPERRRPFFVVLDEVQTYDGAAGGNLAGLLEQSAKFGVRALLLNQNPERLTAQTLNAITTNRSHLLTTALNARAAAMVAKEWGGQPAPAAITRLQRYHFLGQVTHHGQASPPFRIRGVALEQLFEEGRPGRLEALEQEVDRTSGRRPTADALAHLESLDERIQRELKRRRGHPDSEDTRPGGLAISPGRRPS